jgi:hypothetical protein
VDVDRREPGALDQLEIARLAHEQAVDLVGRRRRASDAPSSGMVRVAL